MIRYTRKLDGYSSIFLDSTRLFCAIVVVLGHCNQILKPINETRGDIVDLGHGAVVAFFVVSGYVIAHTTSSKKRTLKTYLVARFSRLYSVYFPAIIITLFCALLSFSINKIEYFQFDRGNNFIRYILTLFFCNELWFLSSAPPVNGPFWSLSFEFWYYILFAVIYYKIKSIRDIWILIIAFIFIGPKILIMFPIWCLGWLAYKIKPLNFKPFAARFISLLFIVCAFILVKILPDYPNKIGAKPLYMANAFISDLLAALCMAISLWLLPSNKEAKLKDSLFIIKLRFYANLTYPIYLFHFPLLVLCECILLKFNFGDTANYFIGLLTTLILCIVFGNYFDKRKRWWDNFFRRIIYKKEVAI